MRTKLLLNKKIICTFIATTLLLGLIISLPISVKADNGNKGSSDLKVDYHTKTEIAQFIKNHPTENAYKNNFATTPSTSSPYSLGQVSQSTLDDACNLLNTYRYIAGIPANVTLKSDYNELAQAASVVDAANDLLSHYPTQPSGMDDAMYSKGKNGASRSNIACGYASWSTDVYNIGNFMDTGWMSDADNGNRVMVGHRRWVLNPTMSQTGFGLAINGSNEVYSAMYAHDTNNSAAVNYKAVAWPAQNTPVGYFALNTKYPEPWSLSMGEEVESASVTITCVNNGKTWTFSGTPDCNKTTDSGYFNINNDYYGQQGCIIFAPKDGVTVSKGYSYNVSVSGVIAKKGQIKEQIDEHSWKIYTGKIGSESFTVNYTVDFFDINDYMNSTPEPTPEQKAQVKAFVNRLYNTTLGRDGEEGGLTYWTDNLLAGNLTGASAAQEFILSKEFKEKDLSYNEFLDVMYAAFFNRPGDAQGYAYWLDVMYNGGSIEYVVACFVDSPEFTGICESYGIVRGDLDKTKGAPASSQGIEPLKVDSSNVNYEELYKYVEKLYTCILDRPSEPAGCEYWVQAIKEGNGMDAGKAASCFFQSQEYKDKKKTDAEFMVDVYQMFFGREPDQGGYDYWLDSLKNGKVSRVWLIEVGFGKSDEFKGILEGYGFEILE